MVGILIIVIPEPTRVIIEHSLSGIINKVGMNFDNFIISLYSMSKIIRVVENTFPHNVSLI